MKRGDIEDYGKNIVRNMGGISPVSTRPRSTKIFISILFGGRFGELRSGIRMRYGWFGRDRMFGEGPHGGHHDVLALEIPMGDVVTVDEHQTLRQLAAGGVVLVWRCGGL